VGLGNGPFTSIDDLYLPCFQQNLHLCRRNLLTPVAKSLFEGNQLSLGRNIMSAATRAQVNRDNAKNSTGPRTEEGKNASRLNALNHGLASSQVVLPHESREDYEKMKAAFEEAHDAGSDFERELLNRMIDAWWRLQRAWRVETQFLAQREEAIANQADGPQGDAALAMMFSDPKEMSRFRLFMRYLASAERAWYRAVADFEKEQKARLKLEREADMREAYLELATRPSLPATGFVPQTADPSPNAPSVSAVHTLPDAASAQVAA
jgi:hypothetical protein